MPMACTHVNGLVVKLTRGLPNHLCPLKIPTSQAIKLYCTLLNTSISVMRALFRIFCTYICNFILRNRYYTAYRYVIGYVSFLDNSWNTSILQLFFNDSIPSVRVSIQIPQTHVQYKLHILYELRALFKVQVNLSNKYQMHYINTKCL
jgi:hypothetical protein